MTPSADTLSPQQPWTSYYPRTYLAPKCLHPPQPLNGDLTKPPWSHLPFSQPFDDIRGLADAPPTDRPPPACRTQMKMTWDDEYLYIGALLHYDQDHPAIATFTERNAPIYQQDSDFEVFVDPLGSTHHYKELELNAINTVWNLMLDKPYNDGGREHSGRVAKPGQEDYYEVYRQKTATQVLQGRLNDKPHDGNLPVIWSVEMALAHSDIMAHIPAASKSKSSCANIPKEGTRWRINFSRVERQGKLNWTWQPQIVWNAKERRYQGLVQMHLPDAWGYVIFGPPLALAESTENHENVNDENDGGESKRTCGEGEWERDETWPARLAVMNVYYAQHAYRDTHGCFAPSLADLQEYLDQDLMKAFQGRICVSERDEKSWKDGFVASVTDGVYHVSVRDDRLLLVNETGTLFGGEQDMTSRQEKYEI